MSQLVIPPNSLVVFVDETGHETLAPGHDVYGLGGCAAMVEQLDAVIREPWRAVRQAITGSPNLPLHASAMRTPTQADIAALDQFFRSNPFARLGAMVSVRANKPASLDPLPIIAGTLMKRIADIAQHLQFDQIHVIFESSGRADPLVESAMAGLGLQVDGKQVPFECYFMPKQAGEPGLEVADFVMHTVGGQVRSRLKGRAGFRLDFQSVFHSVDGTLTSYMEIDTVTPT